MRWNVFVSLRWDSLVNLIYHHFWKKNLVLSLRIWVSHVSSYCVLVYFDLLLVCVNFIIAWLVNTYVDRLKVRNPNYWYQRLRVDLEGSKASFWSVLEVKKQWRIGSFIIEILRTPMGDNLVLEDASRGLFLPKNLHQPLNGK